jgi:DNA-binding response OmpR family regulator
VKKKILVIDDEKDLVEMITFRLEGLGYEVKSAFDGDAGLAMARSFLPDLIILDVMMPKLDGYRVCREIKSGAKTKHIPVIMLTARVQHSDMETGLSSGADAYMIKPFDSATLVEKIAEFL